MALGRDRFGRVGLEYWLGALAVFMTAAGPSWASPAQPTWRTVRFFDASGRPVSAAASGLGRILMFTRADCGPCLIELRHLSDLQAAAKPGALVVVALGEARAANTMLSKLQLPSSQGWRTDTGDAEALASFGGPPPRLPLSVAINAHGALCARRTGLLGSDVVRQWMRQCSP